MAPISTSAVSNNSQVIFLLRFSNHSSPIIQCVQCSYNITQGETASEKPQGGGSLSVGETRAEEGAAGEGVDQAELGTRLEISSDLQGLDLSFI